MRFDIVTLNSSYRGVGRALNTSDFYTPKTKEWYNESLTYYFEYLDLMYNQSFLHLQVEHIRHSVTGYLMVCQMYITALPRKAKP